MSSSRLSGLISGFIHWSEPWGRLGVWMTLWDHEGRPVAGTAEPHAFWELLRKHSPRFQERLDALTRAGISADASCAEIEPQSGLWAITLPVAQRGRPVGVVVACIASPALTEGETLTRLCSRHQLDLIVARRIARTLPQHPRESIVPFASILRAQSESLGGQTLATRDLQDLSAHLAQAYEELNLIYRVSTNLTVLKRPIAYFQEVLSEVLAVTVVRSLAVVIEIPGRDTEPDFVMAGACEADREQLLRLYAMASTCEPNAKSAVLVNDAAGDPQWSWASPWLRQMLYFPLKSHDQQYGGLLAINHLDDGEFGSQEVQLLNAVVERSASFLENVRLYEDLEQLFMGLLHALVSSIDAKDPYTRGHSQRVAWLSRHLASRLELSEDECRRVYLSGLLHDVGKIGISENVLRKSGRLESDEFEEIRQHPEIGARILEGVRQIHDIIPGVLHHHERFDGKGYPHGLAGTDIPLAGRIIGLADSFDAMTTSRTYRSAFPAQIAAAEIRRWSGTQFDPELVDLFLQDDLERLLRVMTDSGQQLAPDRAFAAMIGMERVT